MPTRFRQMRTMVLSLFVLCGFIGSLHITHSAPAAVTTPTRAASFARLPWRFEANQGQAAKSIQFLARGPQAQLMLSAQAATLQVRGQNLALRWLNASSNVRLAGLEPLPERSHYRRGNDARRWQTNVPSYARVRYHALYPGVDLIFYDQAQRLEYDFVIAPGHAARRIALQFSGQQSLRINAAGELVLQLGGGVTVTQRAPCAYQQTTQGRVFVDARYRLLGRGRIGFVVGAYDRRLPLVIDPVLEYASLLGGSGSDEVFAMRVDDAGNTYLAGQTNSTDLPGAGALQAVPGGATDAFVAKVNAAGTALVFAAYLGGSALDYATALALDAQGNVYLTGATYSNDFPLTSGNLPNMNRGYADAFVARLNADGSQLAYSTMLGGNGIDIAYAIAVNNAGQALIAGRGDSADLPNAPRLGQPLYRSHDQAASWNASANGLTAYQTNALAVAPGAPNLVYAATSQGVYVSNDGGAQWRLAGARNVYCYALTVDPRNAQVSYLGTANGLFKSTDGGALYESVNAYNFANSFRPVYHLMFDGGQVAALYVAGANGLAKTSDGGASFTSLPLISFQQSVRVNRIAVEPGASQTVYAATPLGVLKSTNGGASWALLPLTPRTAYSYFGAEAYTVAVDPQTPRTLYAGVSGSNGGVLKSTDGGASWAAANRGLTALAGNQATVLAAHHLSVDPRAGATLYAASYAGGLFRSTDGGANWQPSVNGLRNLLVQALQVDDAGRLWAGTIAGSDILLAQLDPSGGVTALRLLGGSESDEARAVMLDQAGNIYLTGRTTSLNFPTRAPLQAVNRGFSNLQPTADAFVTKLNPAGTDVLYSTYLGGNDAEQGNALALNAAGNVVVSGTTTSTDFPTTPGVFKPLKGDFNQDVFVAALNATGTALQFATYLGGGGEELAGGLALDARGNLYVTGSTRSADFPLMNPLPVQINDFFFRKAFVTKLTPDAATLLFSTWLGGSGQEFGSGVAVDGKRNVYASGSTNSIDFPVLDPLPGNAVPYTVNAFLARFAPQADLAVSSAAQANPVQAGQSYRYTITVTNLGPDEAAGVTLNDAIPNGLGNAMLSASTGANACAGTTNFQCRLGELAVGASATVTLTGSAPASGALNQTASAASETADAVSANNRATLTTAITNLPSLAGRVALPNGAPLAGVTLALSEGQSATRLSAANGAYQFAALAVGGNYNVTATRAGYVLRPANLRFANLQTDQRADFTATACAFTLAANQRAFAAGGGTGTLGITANDAACAWQVRSNAPWLTLNANTGSGNGALSFTVATATATRTGTLSLSSPTGAQLVTITQEVQACPTPSLRVAPGFGVAAAGSELSDGDFNGDGITDLVWFNTPPSEASIWLGNGQGGFSATPRRASFGINAPTTVNTSTNSMAVGDLNNDGRSDLVFGVLSCSLPRGCAGRFDGFLLQEAFAEIVERVEGDEPAAVKQRVMHIVWEDDQFVIDVVRAQQLHQPRSLRKRYVAVVIAVDEQDGRFPFFDLRDRGRLIGDVFWVYGIAPEVHARNVYAGGEEVGIARQCLRRQDAAIRQAPDTDAFGVYVGAAVQVFARRQHVLIFRIAALAAARRIAEILAVANAAAIVDRQHDVALIRQILIDGVSHVIEVPVMIAEQHLPLRAAVNEDERGAALAGPQVFGQEELVVELQAVFGGEQNIFRDDLVFERKVFGQRREDDLRLAAVG